MKNREVSDKSLQIDSLDGLRGFAALIVVFSHTSNEGSNIIPWLNLGGIGKSGVFLFFILSSFLLTSILLKQGDMIFTKKHLSHYWQRRFFRIYPIFFLFLVSVLLSSFLIDHFLGKPQHGIPFNIDLNGFFEHILLLQGKGVTWSIAVEFKFYFVLPFIAYLLYRTSKISVWLSIGILLLGGGIVNWIYPASMALNNDIHLLPYLPIFLFGMALAVFQRHINQAIRIPSSYLKWINILGIIAFITIFLTAPEIFSHLFWPIDKGYFHRDFILYSFIWSFVFFAAVNGDSSITRFFSHPWLRYFGMISFSLYLFHPIIIILFRYANFITPFNGWLVLLIATSMAHISYNYIELPISKTKINWGSTHSGE